MGGRTYTCTPGHRNGGNGTGRKALKEVRNLKKNIFIHKKALFADNPATVILTGAVLTHMTSIAQGDDFDNRNGRQIKMSSVSIKGQLLGISGGVGIVRIIIVRDNDNQGTVPAITDIFATSTGFAQGDHRLIGPNPQRRFTILADKSYVVGSTNANDNLNVPVSISRKVNSKCYFTGTAGTDEGKGSIWMSVVSNLAANVPTFSGTRKVTFMDA